jgi:hypothetical protein
MWMWRAGFSCRFPDVRLPAVATVLGVHALLAGLVLLAAA